MNTAKRQNREPMYGWKNLPWKKFERQVFKLQKRIYRASLRGDLRAVRKLQRLLLKSHSARCLAVRRVSQDNRGKRTAGIDGVASLSPIQRLKLANALNLKSKAQPLRRVWIPKAGSKNGEKRPLGIPTMRDRALQTLAKLALEPEWEARFEPNSYGFRPGRSCHDAIEAIFHGIRSKPKYVLDADIAKCYERISHEALLAKLCTFPSFRRLIKSWLKAGIMDGKELFATSEGVPQGATLSPLLANVALDGLEEYITSAYPKYRRGERWLPLVIRYADDFVVLHQDLEEIERIRGLVAEWLDEMGLELKPEKTRITHTLNEHDGRVGFDFLGFDVRQFPVGKTHSGKRTSKKRNPGLLLGFKTIIRPSKEALSKHMKAIKEIVDAHKAAPQAALIRRLNPLIRGWANYYSTTNSARTLQKADHLTYLKLRRWTKRRHPGKSRKWVDNKYWHVHKGGWDFHSEKDGIRLLKHGQTPIKRHTKVQNRRSPYDSDWVYWGNRTARHPQLPKRVARLLRRQKGKCPWCGLHFKDGELLEVDHVIPTAKGGEDLPNNQQLLHGHCHDEKTVLDLSSVKGANDNGHTIEEPDEGSLSRPVLKTNH